MAWLYSAHGILLCYEALGQFEQGKRVGDQLLVQAQAAHLDAARGLILRPLALLEGRLGNFDRGVAYLSENIDRCRRYGMGGINLGIAYEFRARLAAWANDKTNFQQYMDLCAEQYAAGGSNQELTARIDALLHEARSCGVVETNWQARDLGAMTLSHSQVELRDRLADAVLAKDRCRLGLLALTRSANAAGGYLFGVTRQGVQLLASANASAPAQDLVELVAHYLSVGIEAHSQTQTAELESVYTRSEGAGGATSPGFRGGRANSELIAHVLIDPRSRSVVGVILLRPKGKPLQPPNEELLDIVTMALVAGEDVIAA